MTEIDLTPITRFEYDIDAILNDHAVAEPITRIELILADIVAGNTTTVEPVTRIETYLAIISGADYPVPEPVTRIETFLAIIAGEDYEKPEAVTRLEGLLAEWVEKGSGIWKTVTGTLIHLTDALASPMQKCEVTLEPIQDLHGQDAPYPAGGGKNKYDKNADYYGTGKFWRSSDGTLSDSPDYYASPKIPIKPETAYARTSGTSANIFYDANGDYLSTTYTGGTFTSPINAYYVAFNIANNINHDTVQLEEGSSLSPYSPYSNICPITGLTGCEVTRTGKNLIPAITIGSAPNEDYKSAELAIGTYTISFDTITATSWRFAIRPYDLAGNISKDSISTSGVWNTTIDSWLQGIDVTVKTFVFTVLTPCTVAVRLWNGDVSSATIVTGSQLESGSSATPYEPYSGTTLSATFPETVYGGKYDFVSGEGNSNLVKLPLLSSYAWQLDIPYGRRFGFPYGSNPSFKKATNTNGTFIGNMLAPVNIGVNSHDFGTFYISNSWLVINDNNSHFNSLEDFKSWLESEDVYIVYEVADPTEISLTPQEISTLAGENNVWSNSNGETTIIYKAQAE